MRELSFLLEREVIIAFALIGALIATVGNYLVYRKSADDPGFGKLVLRLGYGITFISIGLFIVAGFLEGGGES